MARPSRDGRALAFGGPNARNAAWRYISTALLPDDRVAIVTSSGYAGSDFTADRVQLHDALFRVAGHSRTVPQGRQCPAIGEYQAFLIDQRQQSDAIEIATQEGYECHCRLVNEDPECSDMERRGAVAQAAQIWSLADEQSLRALDLADAVVRRMAAMPGQRILVLVSPGFLCVTRGKMIDALIDRALRQNVVVNSIDAAGLYTRQSNNPNPMVRHDLQVLKTRIENDGLSVQRDILAGIAAGTGGTYFRNSNDLDTGFHDTAQEPEVSYLLSFSPSIAGVPLTRGISGHARYCAVAIHLKNTVHRSEVQVPRQIRNYCLRVGDRRVHRPRRCRWQTAPRNRGRDILRYRLRIPGRPHQANQYRVSGRITRQPELLA
jgi:VWFA-related protein